MSASRFAVLLGALATSSAGAQDFCPIGGPPSGKCDLLNIGDPVFGPDLTSYYLAEDATVATGTEPLSFKRMFVSSDETWKQATPGGTRLLTHALPKPFGSTASSAHGSLKWWHNYFSFVAEIPGLPGLVDGNLRIVRDTAGAQTAFRPACLTPGLVDPTQCEAAPDVYNPSVRHRLFKTFDAAGKHNGYVLRRGDGVTDYYQHRFAASANDPTWFLITRSVGAGGLPRFSVTYQNPSGKCPGAQGAGGSPYVHRVLSPGGVGFEFSYELKLNTASAIECPLVAVRAVATNNSGISTRAPWQRLIEFPAQGRGQPPTSPPPAASPTLSYGDMVRFEYAGDGLIGLASGSKLQEHYEYKDGAADIFRRKRGGSEVALQRFAGAQVSHAAGEGSSFSFTTGSSPTVPCESSSQCCGHDDWAPPNPPIRRTAQESVGLGDGSGADTQVSRAFDYARDFGYGMHGARLYRVSDACAANAEASCSGGERRYEHRGAPASLPSPALTCHSQQPGYLHAVKDKRGNWLVTPNAAVQIGTINRRRLEHRQTLRGASDPDGTGALETIAHTWTYDSAGLQRPKTTSRESLLGGAGTSTFTEKLYDAQGRLVADYAEGWTVDSVGVARLRRVKTFYRLARACGSAGVDPHGRALRVEGPCAVAAAGDLSCAGTGYPVTEYTYFDDAAPGAKGGRLAAIVRYPDAPSCAGGLAEEFLDYTVEGDPRQVRDANGVVTTLEYEGRNLIARTVGNRVWRYRYENGQRAEQVFPEGNREVFCYRKDTPTASCTGGTYTTQLQWKARTAVSDGSTWSEKVVYTYRASDQQLLSETRRDGCFFNCTPTSGEVRSVRRYDADAQGRPTFEASGKVGTPSTQTVRAFDGADNLVRVGHAFNAPLAFCGSEAAPSPACAQLGYDRANRLTALDELPSAGVTVRTRMAYDAHGNVCAVTSGASASWSATGCTVAAPDDARTAYYRHDDFGNVVEVRLPNQTGVSRMAYDAAGNMVFKKTPATPNGHLLFELDGLGRHIRTIFEDVSPPLGFVTVLYSTTWDSPGTVPPGCPALTNAKGRAARVDDPLGTTFFSYDEGGRLLLEARLRPSQAGCSTPHSEASPHTAYTYSQNGELSSITYPHGRMVTYVHHPDLAQRHRVERVRLGWWGAGQWSTRVVLSNLFWEPYGGLRSYLAHNAATQGVSFAVDYALGDDSGGPKSAPCDASTSLPLQGFSDDETGRLRMLAVTRQGPGGTGNVFRRWYTWKGDQLTKAQTCLLGQGPFEEDYGPPGSFGAGYDAMQRLFSAKATPVTAFDTQFYQWDERGNPVRRLVNGAQGYDFTLNPNPARPDEVVRVAAGLGTGTQLALSYESDADGRVISVRWPLDSTGQPNDSRGFVYGPDPQKGEVDTAINAASIRGVAFFNYYFDAQGRRRSKVYPSGGADEFFYANGRQLLEDRGLAEVFPVGPFNDQPIDEYIWLDGRPVVLVRGRFDNNFVRQSDGPFACSRNDESYPCGLYFPVTDYLGKPVLLLDAQGRIAGTGEYDPFGHVNRRDVWGESQHPYPPGVAVQAPVVHQDPLGLELDVRVQFHTLDTEGCWLPGQGSAIADPVWVVNSSTGVRVGPYGGHPRGASWSDWLRASPMGDFHVRFDPDGQNRAPDQNGCANGPANAFPYAGYSVKHMEYRRYEVGAQPTWLPLRLPGQYFDAETDLFENWHRNMDGFLGRYLSPEPILSDPSFVAFRARDARTFPAYAYANNNPVGVIDPTGLYSVEGACDIPSKGKEKAEIERIANKYADKLEDFPQLCGLNSFKNCVKGQIRDVKLTCNENTTIECKKPVSEGRERAAYVTDLGLCGAPTDRIFWCNRKLTADQAARVLVHEAAHTCGWQHCQGRGVPDNGCNYDELR